MGFMQGWTRGKGIYSILGKMSSLRFNSIFGFRSDYQGIHTSRPMMLADLSTLLAD